MARSAHTSPMPPLGSYLLSLWPLPVFLTIVQGVMWLSGNSRFVGLPFWISDVDMLLFLTCFALAAIWTYLPLLGGHRIDAGTGVPVASLALAGLPLRSLKAFAVGGAVYGGYLLLLVLKESHGHGQPLSGPMLASLLLSVGYCALVLVPALGLMVTQHHSISLRLQRQDASDLELMRANNPLHGISDSTRRPWLVFVITGLLPTSLMVVFAYLASMDSSATGTRFIAGQGLLLFASSMFASTCLVWLVTRALKMVAGELSSGLEYLRKGRYEGRVAVLTDDDFGDLAHGLNLALGGLAEREELKGALAVAAEIQQGLLPDLPNDVPGYRFAAVEASCQAVAGDYYDVIKLSDGRCWMVIADVAGKGYPAALTVANLQAMLHVLAAQDVHFDEAVAFINRQLCRTLNGGRFVTLFLAKLQPESHSLLWLNAGHVPPLLQTADGVRTLAAGTPPLGMLPELSFSAERVELAPGDRLLLYTDGVTEMPDVAGGEMFGEQRLTAWLQEARGMPAADLPHRLLARLGEFGDGQREDDVTILCLEREAA